MSEASSLKATPCSSVDVPEWDALNLVTQNANFSEPPPLPAFDVSLLESQGAPCSTTDLVEQIPRLACFNSGSFLEAINCFALSEGCIRNPRVPLDFSSKIDQGMEKDFNGRKRKTVLDDDSFDSHSSFNRIQSFQSEQQKNVQPGTVKSSVEKDEKRQIVGSNTRKSNLKHAKENPQNGDSSKEDYIHIRAKRGQATNSHSLAERVRREKISERMRFLQNLVPGCSKITGKAVMLDEIINYVQSLQRQVEFLSMKLATVNPELNIDIEQLFSKDILQLRAGNSASLMFDPGMSNSSPHLHGYTPQALMHSEMAMPNTPISQAMLKSTLSNICHVPQTSSSWDDEFQNVFQMSFMPNMHASGTEQPGSMKLE